MRKIQIVALGAFVAFGAFLSSCGGDISTNPTLKSDVDTVSYAYGASLYDNGGLGMHLKQLGLITDTAQTAGYYKGRISAETDAAKKAELEKEMKTKIDSISKANDKNIAEFLKGLQEGIKAADTKTAYVTGLTIGNQISKQMFPFFIEQVYGESEDSTQAKKKVNEEVFLSGLATAMKQGKLAVEDPSALIDAKTKAVQEKAEAKREAELKKQFGPQIEEGAKFLEENKAKEGVVALPNGLQYKIIKEGNGAKPSATDVVKVHYHGTLIDGTVFDSSVERKDPATFGVNQVIKGWTEILQLMPVGSKWIVYVPYDLAYGAQDRGKIKPFSTLIFEIELLGIETPAQPTATVQAPQ